MDFGQVRGFTGWPRAQLRSESINLSINLSNLTIYLSIYLSTYLPTHLPTYLPNLSIYLLELSNHV